MKSNENVLAPTSFFLVDHELSIRIDFRAFFAFWVYVLIPGVDLLDWTWFSSAPPINLDHHYQYVLAFTFTVGFHRWPPHRWNRPTSIFVILYFLKFLNKFSKPANNNIQNLHHKASKELWDSRTKRHLSSPARRRPLVRPAAWNFDSCPFCVPLSIFVG